MLRTTYQRAPVGGSRGSNTERRPIDKRWRPAAMRSPVSSACGTFEFAQHRIGSHRGAPSAARQRTRTAGSSCRKVSSNQGAPQSTAAQCPGLRLRAGGDQAGHLFGEVSGQLAQNGSG